MNIKPGDIFMWVDDVDFDYVPEFTSIYCDPESNTKRARCDGICFCIGYANNMLYWISNNRITQLSINDVYAHGVWLKPKKIK